MAFFVRVLLPDKYIYSITTSQKRVGIPLQIMSENGEDSWERPRIRRRFGGTDWSIVSFQAADDYGYRHFTHDGAFENALSVVDAPYAMEVMCWEYDGYVTLDGIGQSLVRDIDDQPIAPWESVLFHGIDAASYDDEDGNEVMLDGWDEVMAALGDGQEVYIEPAPTDDEGIAEAIRRLSRGM